jgi:hypothetical protein
MRRPVAIAAVSVLALLAGALPAAPDAESARDACRLPRQAPVHWRAPLGLSQRSSGLPSNYWAVYPPSMISSLPVMNFDSSDAR